ncbi:MAG: S8 family serine peptidase [Saprospiraceae bacterium]|nr:S8 family serine peptidase [Saprospiraceae bacterium]MDP4701460.1 S8 family serine peptidase [Saprospiraceae bacterium]MDP4811331.1 S8 family serine peptidase [Saprospiraceae bacterium]MDP4815085.1 S8 family serine peptidase [Saprospiraceae bacterium]MDP4852581.1 S8 family serine peptidase [Saprospiraceae bacterium]
MKIKIYLLTLLLLPALTILAQKESTINLGQLLVKFKPQVVPENFMVGFQTYARDGGGIWLEKKLSKAANINLIGYDTLTVNAINLLEEIKKDPQVEYACFDISVEPRGDMPDDPNLASQWGLFSIGTEKVWEITKGGVSALGDTIVVAILDTGFDINHEDLKGNIWINKGEKPGDKIDNDQNGYVDDVSGWNFIHQSAMHVADNHGSSVAGIIGAKGNNGKGISGMNWHVKLMVFETRLVSDIIAAYDYIIEQRERYNRTKGKQGAFVVTTNASFGVNKIKCVDQPLWGEMYDRLGAAGILSAAGAANNPWNVDEVGDMPTTCKSDYLMTVLNTNPKDERYAGSAFGAVSIDMGAPGQNSFSTRNNNEYGAFHGNSAAAPHLAGAIALLYSIPRQKLAEEAMAFPAQTAMKIRNLLLNNVDKVPSLVSLTSTGGRLNVFSSMLKLLEIYPEKKPEMPTGKLLVYPNPSIDEIYVEIAKPENETSLLSIYNAIGQQVKQIFMPEGVNRARVMTNGWKPGNYWVFSPGVFNIQQATFIVQGQ